MEISRFQDGRIRVDWCSAPGRPDGLLSLDMPVQLAVYTHLATACPPWTQHMKNTNETSSRKNAPEHKERNIICIVQEKLRSPCTPDGPTGRI